jgi:hypothetical protein
MKEKEILLLESGNTPSCLLHFVCRHPPLEIRGRNEKGVKNKYQKQFPTSSFCIIQ